jgi:hypothetical protein
MPPTENTVTRREILKRGALIGGAAVLWTTPVVQAFGMSRAQAQAVSQVCSIYCIVWRPSEPGSPSTWAVSEGDKCLPCPADTVAGLPPDIGDFTVDYAEAARTYTVTYPDTYALVPAGDPTPDDLVNASAAIRRGENTGSCEFLATGDQQPGQPLPNTTQIEFTDWDAASGDRIELVIKHCI